MADSQGQRRVCDYCGASTALLYCRADTAKLCFGCDREVHSTNPLFGKHGRSPLCDACDESSASIFCETERFLLCQNCDWERHDLSRGGGAGVVHNRRPIEGFTGCPSASELMGFLGVEDLGVKVNECLDGDDKEAGVGEFSDVLLWETPAFVTLDDLIVSRDDSCALRAVDVPSLPKNRNATCGRHKKEMLRQLRLLAKPESNFHFDEAEPVSNIHLPVLEQALQSADMQTGCDVDGDENAFYEHEWFCNDGETKGRAYQPSAFSGSCHEPTTSEKPAGISVPTSASECLEGPLDQPNKPNLSSLVPRAQYDLTGLDRESAISRYKEKRKTRRYEKHIRYESRKARAESRIRVKGRFAKMDKTWSVR